MRTGTGLIGAGIAALGLSQPALAETVVVKCMITSGNPGWVINGNAGRPAGPITYKIGDGKWLVWGEAGPAWGRNYCTDIGQLHVAVGAKANCDINPKLFDVTMSSPEDDIAYEVRIDRQTGAITTSEESSDGIDRRSAGTCEKAAEPKPPPPPPTKF